MPQGVAPSTSMGTDGGANQTTAHCENLSMCEEDPSYCQSSVSGIQGAILIFLMLYPPLIATLTPTLTRLHKKSYPHSRDRLLMPGLADSYDDADVLQSPRRTSLVMDNSGLSATATPSSLSLGSEPRRPGSTSRPLFEPLAPRQMANVADSPGMHRHATHGMIRTEIDPPLILDGLCPLDCGISGLMAIIAVMFMTVNVFFFGAVFFVDSPCNYALGACSTISCVCGNMVQQGYVFMFVTLVITSLILVQRISAMPHRQQNHHRTFKPVLILGALMLTFTGIFPEVYGANGKVEFSSVETFHLVGVGGAALFLHFLPYCLREMMI